jgi:beta-alanine degradation protein BauB
MKKVIFIFCLSATILMGAAVILTARAQNVTHRIPMFENDQVKVWKTIIIPNSPLSMHRHEHGRTIVVLKGGTLTIRQDTGEKKNVEWKTGQAYWLDADPPGNKQHADVNETNDTIEVMVIENKKTNESGLK